MRKLLWGGVALLVLGATSVYIAADQAAKNPNSFLGRYACGAATLALTGNPFAFVQQLQHTDVEKVKDEHAQGLGNPAEVAKPVEPPLDENEFNESEEPQQDVPDPTPVIQVPSSCDLETMDKCPSDNEPIAQSESWNRIVPGSSTNDTEAYADFIMAPEIDKPPVMPEVADDEEASSAPSCTPTCTTKPTSEESMGWEEIGTVEIIPVMPTLMPSDDNSTEEEAKDQGQALSYPYVRTAGSDASRIGLFEIEQDSPVVPEESSAPSEDSLSWFIRVLGLEPLIEAIRETKSENVLEPSSSDEPPDGTPARDPNYYRYHYQGCPYSGCPYPQSYPVPPYTPNVEPTPTPEDSETKTPSKKKRKCSTQTQSFWQQVISNLQESSNQPGIDTMECRPSDVPQFDLRRLMPF